MAKIYYDQDAELEILQDKNIAVIGYGNQGHAQAQNLKESGCRVVVGARPDGKSWKAAEQAGLEVATIDKAVEKADIIALLLPDWVQSKVYQDSIKQNLSAGNLLLFAHGFSIHFHQIIPPPEVDVAMVAPKGPGPMLRRLYQEGTGIPALIAVHQASSGKAKEKALAYAKALGCTKAGVLETTFAEETESDLFGEQVVLCGGVSNLIKNAFEVLVEAGYQPEIAYFECLHELKLIVDLIYRGGLNLMRRSVSDTAEYGDYTRGPQVIDEHVRERMKHVLKEVREGNFSREWILENQAGCPSFNALRKREREQLIEQVGGKLRELMPWLKEG